MLDMLQNRFDCCLSWGSLSVSKTDIDQVNKEGRVYNYKYEQGAVKQSNEGRGSLCRLAGQNGLSRNDISFIRIKYRPALQKALGSAKASVLLFIYTADF